MWDRAVPEEGLVLLPHAPVDLAVVAVRADTLVLAAEALYRNAQADKRVAVVAVVAVVVAVMRVTPPVRAFSMLEAAEVAAA